MKQSLLYIFSATLLCSVFLSVSVNAQQVERAPFIEGTRFGWNPAMTAGWDYIDITAVYNQQWSGFEGAPNNVALSAQMPFVDYNTGLGLQIMQEETGPLENLAIQLNYAYYMPLSGEGSISLGVGAQMRQYQYDPSNETVVDMADPRLLADLGKTSHLNLSAGILFRSVDRDDWLSSHLYFGLSAYQALPSSLIFSDDTEEVDLKRTLHALVLLGYRLDLDNSFIDASVQLDYAAPVIESPRFNITYELQEAFWAGIAIDGSFSTYLQLGYIMPFGYDSSVRLGLYGGRPNSASGLELGTSYGFVGAVRLVR